MPIDINLLRAFKGGVPELIRLSQAKRFADVGLVDRVIALDDVVFDDSRLIKEMEKVSWHP